MDYSKLSTATLEALSSGQKLDYTKLSDDELSELGKITKSTPKIEEPVSKTESALRGAVQGGLMGFADEATGVGQGLIDQILGSDSSFADAYQQHRDESRRAYDAAEEANPKTYFAGNLAGGLVSGLAIPIGGSANLAKAAATAGGEALAKTTLAKAMLNAGGLGAVGGLGASEADSAYGMAKDTALGGLIGSSVGAAFHGTGKGLGALAKTDTGKQFARGVDGTITFGKEAFRKVGDEVRDFSGQVGEKVKQAIIDESKLKQEVIKAADASGEKYNSTNVVDEIIKSINEMPKSINKYQTADRARALESLENFKANQGVVKETKTFKPVERLGSVDEELSALQKLQLEAEKEVASANAMGENISHEFIPSKDGKYITKLTKSETAPTKVEQLMPIKENGKIVDYKLESGDSGPIINTKTHTVENIPGSPGYSKIKIQPPEITKTTSGPYQSNASDLDHLNKTINQLANDQNIGEAALKNQLLKGGGEIATFANKSIPGVEKTNKNLQNLIEAQRVFNAGDGLDEYGNVMKLAPLFEAWEKNSSSGNNARYTLRKGLDALKEVHPGMADEIEKLGMDLAERSDLVGANNVPISLNRNLGEMARRVSGQASNAIGLGVGAVKNSVPGKMLSKTIDFAPDAINKLATHLESTGEKRFAPLLRNISNQTEPKRKALMFSLMQQPGFRELFKYKPDTEE